MKSLTRIKQGCIALAFASSLGAPMLANAANTISFNGEVTDQTCQAVINGKSDPTVVLPSVKVSDLQGLVGKSAGETPFKLELTNCVAPSAEEKFTVLFQAPNPTSSNNLSNTAGSTGAKGVALQLLDAPGGSPVVFTGGIATAGVIKLPAQQTNVTHDYAVRYISEDTVVTAGPVLGSVTYTVRYE